MDHQEEFLMIHALYQGLSVCMRRRSPGCAFCLRPKIRIPINTGHIVGVGGGAAHIAPGNAAKPKSAFRPEAILPAAEHQRCGRLLLPRRR
jgi:hypothetical protein